MSANKHTPGPWKAVEPATIDWRDPFVQTADGESTVALTCGGGPDVAIAAPAQRANARLIAAAPELLEALERIARPQDCGCKPCTNTCRNQIALEIAVEEIQELARAAIAKATGSAA